MFRQSHTANTPHTAGGLGGLAPSCVRCVCRVELSKPLFSLGFIALSGYAPNVA